MRHALRELAQVFAIFFGALLIVFVAVPWAKESISERIFEYTNCYATEMQLFQQGWDISISFGENPDSAWATTQANPRYLRTRTQYDTVMLAVDEFSDREIRELVLHELWHAEVWDLAEALWERNEEMGAAIEEPRVTLISRMPFWYDLCR